MDAATSAKRLRIAAVLLNRNEEATRRAVAAMNGADRARLASQISWVQDYEATENPTWEE